MINIRTTVTILAAAASIIGCNPKLTPRALNPITIETKNITAQVDYSGLDAVLKAAVKPDGEILPEKLRDNAKMLEGQLMLMTLAGPKTKPALFTNDHARLNYWYNARAAWSLRLMLTFSDERIKADETKIGEDPFWIITNDGPTVKTFNSRPFPIDGRSMTLALIDELLRDDFGFQAAIGAPGVDPLRAAIPDKSFDSTNAGTLIYERFNGFIDDSKRFVIDVPTRQIQVPPVLWQFSQHIITEHSEIYDASGANLTTALLPMVKLSPHRRLQDAVGYACIKAPAEKIPLITPDKD
ncbi:MAG: hypothetical protein HN350_13995 [Phycisphaerales bacterium]|jgi:hypothetical protein|nr:hypothetical protein [Phycisphaerales bacterium]